VLLDSTHMKAHRCATGGRGVQRTQALGVSPGGRTTKIHALSDSLGCPLAFLPTPGQAADCRAAEALLQCLPMDALVMAEPTTPTSG
jgi:hypothetical protein